MPNVTIASTTTQLKWQGGDPPTLVIESAGPTLTPEGVPVNNGGGPFRNEYSTTVNGSSYVVVPSVALPSGVTYIAYFQKANAYDSASRIPFSVFGPQNPFYVPADTPTTWDGIDAARGGALPVVSGNRTVNGYLNVTGAGNFGGAVTAPDFYGDLHGNVEGGDISGGSGSFSGLVIAQGFAGDGRLITGVLGVGGSGGSSSTGSHTFWADTDDNDPAALADTKVGAVTVARAHRDYFRSFKPVRLPGYATGSLPAGTEGFLAYNTDIDSPVFYDGSAWKSFASSPVTVYASRNGVVMDSDLESGGGTDNTAALQALLDLAPALGSVYIVVDGPALCGAIDIHSNTVLDGLGFGGLYLKNGTNRALLRNANPIGSGAVTDKNITLRGMTFNGNCANQTGLGFVNRREADGTLIGLVQLYGVENVRVLNCNFIESKSIALHFSNATNFWVVDCYIDNNVVGEFQQGGCQVEGPASNFTIRGLKGSTQDDLVGIASDDDDYVESPFTGLGPYVAGGDITDWSVLDIEGIGNTLSAVRLFNPGASANRIDRGLIDGVTGTFTVAVLWNESGGPSTYDSSHGNIGTVTLRNVNVHMIDDTSVTDIQHGIGLYNSIDNLILENINFNDPEDNRGHLFLHGECDIKFLSIDGFRVFDTVDNSSTVMCFLDSGARLRHGEFRNLAWKRGSAHARALALMIINTSCTVDELFIDRVYATRVDDIVRRLCATTTARLTLRNVTHLGATSSANATVSNPAGTISLLEGSGWYSDAAVRTFEVGGTITAKRGDAFDPAIYRALLTQSSTSAPTVTVLQNTLGGTVVWARSSAGVYTATLSGAFTANKTAPQVFNNDASGSDALAQFSLRRTDANTLTLETLNANWGTSGAPLSDGLLTGTVVEVLVYP